MTKSFKIAAICLIVLMVIVVLPFVLVPLYNDACLKKAVKALEEYPLPPNAQLLEAHGMTGVSETGDSGMNCVAIILIRSELSAGEIYSSYGAYELDDGKVYTSCIDEVTSGRRAEIVVCTPKSCTEAFDGRFSNMSVHWDMLHSCGYDECRLVAVKISDGNGILDFFDYRSN